MIEYTNNLENITIGNLNGFFIGWPNPPSNEVFLTILSKSYKSIMAKDGDKIVGFINAISDGVLSAYIPLLEVLPSYQGKGIGKKLVEKMLSELENLYMIDLLCDEELIPYYEKLGMTKSQGVCIRNYNKQSGRKKS